jgi:hypothetical protein
MLLVIELMLYNLLLVGDGEAQAASQFTPGLDLKFWDINHAIFKKNTCRIGKGYK